MDKPEGKDRHGPETSVVSVLQHLSRARGDVVVLVLVLCGGAGAGAVRRFTRAFLKATLQTDAKMQSWLTEHWQRRGGAPHISISTRILG